MYILSSGDFIVKPNDYARYDIIPDVKNRPFSDWLAEQMRVRGWGNADLAKAAKINRQVVWGWLNRNKQPSEEMLQAVAKALAMDVQEVYRAAGILPPAADTDQWVERIAHTVNQLPENEKELVHRYAEMLRNMIDQKNGNKKRS
jgi:transcriptional regulator with XRE-family HTH domain